MLQYKIVQKARIYHDPVSSTGADRDPLVIDTDPAPEPDPDPSIIKQK